MRGATDDVRFAGPAHASGNALHRRTGHVPHAEPAGYAFSREAPQAGWAHGPRTTHAAHRRRPVGCSRSATHGRCVGGLPERPKGTVLKTVVARATVGSNPTPTAVLRPLTRYDGQGPLSYALPAEPRRSPRLPGRSGTEGVTPHDLRASHGTWVADRYGVMTAAHRLGHSNASVTTRHYARPVAGRDGQVAEAADSWLGGHAPGARSGGADDDGSAGVLAPTGLR